MWHTWTLKPLSTPLISWVYGKHFVVGELDLIVALQHGTGVQVRQGQNLSERLPTTSGVRQGCVLTPALFCVAIDWILRHMKDKPGIDVVREHFSDLMYAHDMAFLVNTTSDAESEQLPGHRFGPRPADILAKDKAAES